MTIGEAGALPVGACAVHEPELDPAFDLVDARELACPLVLSSPHSGAIYPRSFLASARLDATALRRSEDAFVDELFAGATEVGAPLLRALFPRAYLDLNREPYELDPRMFDGRLPPYVNARSVRVAGGLGTIARIVGDAQEIYAGRLTVQEGLNRIERLYRPYHAALKALIERAHQRFGLAILIDCHSMPSLPAGLATSDKRIATDVVVGDRYGTSADHGFVDTLERAMRSAGFSVQRNKPYAGGFITEHYGRPMEGVHAIQIEINRSLYMDERALQRSAAFATIRDNITSSLSALACHVLDASTPRKAAAE